VDESKGDTMPLPAELIPRVEEDGRPAGWIATWREEAREATVALALPTEADEEWRYSPIDALDWAHVAARRPSGPDREPSGAVLDAARRAGGEVAGSDAVVCLVVDGRLLGRPVAPDGVRLDTFLSSPDRPVPADRPEAVVDALGRLWAADGLVVDVADGVEVEETIVVVHLLSGTPGIVSPQLAVRLGAGARARLVELALSPQSVDARGSAMWAAADAGPIGGRPAQPETLVLPSTHLVLGPAAELAYLGVERLGPDVWQLGRLSSRLAEEAILRSFTVALGGAYARLETDCRLVGHRARSELKAAYLGRGRQVLDFRTRQSHEAAETTSDLLFKGAVGDSARSVYTGLIAIRPGARKSDAFQTNRNLVLSPGAHADSVPNLDIAENDVRCSHASAVGPVDPAQVWYLETRGVPPAEAERLIVRGFFRDLLAAVPVPGARGTVEEWVVGRLAAGEGSRVA
jgi:Fe-S cluster assembly protein SufD